MKKLFIKVWLYFVTNKEEKSIQRVAKKDHAFLGDKQVKIRKLTPALWKELVSVVDQLPGLIVHTIVMQKDNQTLVYFLNELIDDVIKIVSVLSDLEEDYLHKNAGFDELVSYLTLTFQKNDFSSVIKNVKSLLPKQEKVSK
ncbi:MAG: hypothetical protein ACQET8_22695 [Bacillota bacterium]